MKFVSEYLWSVGDCLSQLVNNALLFANNPNQSISGRAYQNRLDSHVWHLAYQTINALFFWQDNHCLEAHINDRVRARTFLDTGRQ